MSTPYAYDFDAIRRRMAEINGSGAPVASAPDSIGLLAELWQQTNSQLKAIDRQCFRREADGIQAKRGEKWTPAEVEAFIDACVEAQRAAAEAAEYDDGYDA